MNEGRISVLFSLQLLKSLYKMAEGTTRLRCESYFKTHYVCSATGGRLSKKRRQLINTLSGKRTFSLANLGSEASVPPPLSSSAASARGWKGQRCTFLETVWSINCTDSLDQWLLFAGSWVFFSVFLSLMPFQDFIQILIFDFVNSAGSREHRSNLERL